MSSKLGSLFSMTYLTPAQAPADCSGLVAHCSASLHPCCRLVDPAKTPLFALRWADINFQINHRLQMQDEPARPPQCLHHHCWEEGGGRDFSHNFASLCKYTFLEKQVPLILLLSRSLPGICQSLPPKPKYSDTLQPG